MPPTEVRGFLVKKKIHEATKFASPLKTGVPVLFLYLQPNAVKQLGNPSEIEIVIRPVPDQSPNAAVAANGAVNESLSPSQPR